MKHDLIQKYLIKNKKVSEKKIRRICMGFYDYDYITNIKR